MRLGIFCLTVVCTISIAAAQETPSSLSSLPQELKDKLSPAHIGDIQSVTADQIKAIEQQLTTEQKNAIEKALGLEPGGLSDIPVSQIASWVSQLTSSGVDWQNLPAGTRQRLMGLMSHRLRVQRVIDKTNPPYYLTSSGPKRIGGLTYDQNQLVLPAEVLKAADSIGRIEDSNGALIGTAWVIKKQNNEGIVATNCHVAEALVAQGQGAIPQGTTITFEPKPGLQGSRKFALKATLYMPTEKGLDIALLSADLGQQGIPASNFPDALLLQSTDSLPVNGYFIGYAGSATSSNSFDTEEFRKSLQTIGTNVRIASNARISAAASFQDFDVMLHDASTHYGSSGSPLLAESGRVIAIHNCCNGPRDVVPGQTCYSTTIVTPFNNQAINADAFASPVANLSNTVSTVAPSSH